MERLKPEFLHQDSRRILSQLLTDNIKQVNLYEAKAGSILGNHHHRDTIEYFYVIEGTGTYNDSEPISKGAFFKVIPKEHHSIFCITDLKMMTFLTRSYTKELPDIYV